MNKEGCFGMVFNQKHKPKQYDVFVYSDLIAYGIFGFTVK